MLYFEKTLRLVKEYLLLKKYKSMNIVLAIFVFIFMLPFHIAFFVWAAYTFIMSIIYSIIEAPIKFLHTLIRDETKDSHVAFKIVLYYLSWPIIFPFYVFYAFMIVDIIICYLIAQVLGYIASLTGYRFHITPMEEDISVEPKNKYNLSAIIHIAVVAGLFLLGVLFIILGIFTVQALLFVGIGIVSLIGGFEAIYSLIAYRDWKKKEKPALEAKEEPKEE